MLRARYVKSRQYRRIEFRFRNAYDRHLQRRPSHDSTKLNINPSNCNLSIDSRPCFLVTLNAHIPRLIKRRGWRSIAYRGDRGARTKLLGKHLAVSCMQMTPYHDAKRLGATAWFVLVPGFAGKKRSIPSFFAPRSPSKRSRSPLSRSEFESSTRANRLFLDRLVSLLFLARSRCAFRNLVWPPPQW